jgi:hypothetical protein
VLRHTARVDGALERTAEGDADRHRRADPVGERPLDDPFRAGDALLHPCARVAPVELLRRREREVHLAEAALAQPVVAAFVHSETRVDDSLAPLDRRDDRLRPGHLRHVLRADEAHGLDAGHAGSGEQVDELGADRRLERGRLVLQPVARPHVADDDAHTTPSSRSVSSSDAVSPSRPR